MFRLPLPLLLSFLLGISFYAHSETTPEARPLTGSISVTGPRDEYIQGKEYSAKEAEEYFRCRDASAWDPTAPEHDVSHNFQKCSHDKAIQDANEVYVVRAKQMATILQKIQRAQDSSDDEERDRILGQFRVDGFCLESDDLDACEKRVRRRVVAQEIALREATLKTQRLRKNLGDEKGLQVKAEGSTEAAPRQENQEAPRKAIDLVNDLRKQSKDAKLQKNPPSCRDNPFIPCVISYSGTEGKDKKAPPVLPLDSDALLEKNFGLSKVEALPMGQGEPQDAQAVDSSGAAIIDSKLTHQVQKRTRDSKSVFYEKNFLSDRKIFEKRQEEEQKRKANYLRLTPEQKKNMIFDDQKNRVSWDSLNNALDEVEQLHKKGEGPYQVLEVERQPQKTNSDHGKKANQGQSLDGFIRGQLEQP